MSKQRTSSEPMDQVDLMPLEDLLREDVDPARQLPPNLDDVAAEDRPLLEQPLPCADDANDVPVTYSAGRSFLYIGRGLTMDQFMAYAEGYTFGSAPPDFVVLHHTERPGATWGHNPSAYDWDEGEASMTVSEIYWKRKAQLDTIRDWYQTVRGWDRGPHLFVDDRWIWLFTPMYYTGIHAAGGNYYYFGGRLHYSVGIEVVGYFDQRQWPPAVAQRVAHTVRVLQSRLGTFAIRYQKYAGGISSHRDYNKPWCPGATITSQYYINVIRTM